MQGSGEFGAGGYDRDNRCGECGRAIGQVHLANCKTGERLAEEAIRRHVRHVGCTCNALLGQSHTPGCAIWREVGVHTEDPPARVVERIQWTTAEWVHSGIPAHATEAIQRSYGAVEIRSHGPADHGPEFWSSGCKDPACEAERENERRKAWLLQQPEYMALSTERNEIMRALHERASHWDWDAWYDGEWDATQWSEETVKEIYRIIGLEVPKP